MHNVFKISLVVRREALSITLLVEGCTDLENIVHFYRVRVIEFSTRGGRVLSINTPIRVSQLPSDIESILTMLAILWMTKYYF
jgi:hypothetical protein